jgi:hypothetical protein
MIRAPQVLSAAALALALAFFGAIAVAQGAQHDARIFESPGAAAQALADAWRTAGREELLSIFGADGEDLVVSGDLIEEKRARSRLVAEYDSLHRIESTDADHAQLILGTLEFPYPIPLVRDARGWRFDARSGAQEILHRRIGRNELNAIEVCRAYVEAQREFSARRAGSGVRPEYAMKIMSSDGARDGLYWPALEGEDESPLGPLIATAAADGYGEEALGTLAPYHGYYYRILTGQGAAAHGGARTYLVDGHMTRGFALVAFPAKYRDSGVMTFVVNQDGIVFQKDLGAQTAEMARRIARFDPDSSWTIP